MASLPSCASTMWTWAARTSSGAAWWRWFSPSGNTRRHGGAPVFSTRSEKFPAMNLFGRLPMKRQSAIGFVLVMLGLSGSCLGAESKKAVVIHAGQLFDGKSDQLLSQQVIVIQDDRIAEVGPPGSVKIPAGAEEINLGTGTVLPGLIEGHNHMFKIGDYPGTGAEAA